MDRENGIKPTFSCIFEHTKLTKADPSESSPHENSQKTFVVWNKSTYFRAPKF